MYKKILKSLLAVTTGLMIAAGLVVMGGNGIPANQVEASDLTLVTDVSKVTYRATTAEEVALLKKLFDVEYYKAQNPELVDLLGGSYKALFDHFCKYGVYEGRTCNAKFDPSAYVSAYPDARDAAKNDILNAYIHYVNVGLTEGRTLTTVEACAKEKITVRSMIDDSIVITPEVYETAVKLGITDYKAVTKAIEIAKQQAAAGNTVVITNNTSSDDSDDSSSSGSLAGYTKVQTISAGNGLHICVYKSTGYAAYHLDGDLNMVGLIASTDGYTGDASNPGDVVALIPVYVSDTAYGTVTPVVPANSNFITTGDEVGSTVPNRTTSGIEVEVESDYGGTNEEIADTSANSSTTYDVGFKFNDASDDSVSFSVGVEGSDGFTLEDVYTVDIE
ncbi:MAG: hypothetical protein J6I68_05995 [Butyrivibrio sp.]|uniref:hypothetical protein n=1 Tax=Butyrivibrio sp. TaxID=28121 RepID=UPI001B6E3872|nr:hypothetical protein [Butyrivibrio sp.]MBP3782780.1 hypothetical protein [Butyrivibrio sp.]